MREIFTSGPVGGPVGEPPVLPGGELGGDQYQGRLWPGFHRHAVTVMLAYSFLVWLELRQRRNPKSQGRRGDSFSPSPEGLAQDTARRAS